MTKEVKDFSDQADARALYLLIQREKLKKYGIAITDDLKLTTVDKLR